MNLTQTIKELRAEQEKLEKVFQQKLGVIKQAILTLQGLIQTDWKPLPVTKKSFIVAPALKAHHYKWNYKGVCANPDCKFGPGETPKHFRAKTSRKKYCCHGCTSHAQYLKLLNKPGGNETKAAPSAPVAKAKYIRDKNILPKKYNLFCQLPSCGKPFKAAKPWARGCEKHRTTYWRDQMAPLKPGQTRTMTASMPPAQPGKPVKLIPGDPLRAGSPDAVR